MIFAAAVVGILVTLHLVSRLIVYLSRDNHYNSNISFGGGRSVGEDKSSVGYVSWGTDISESDSVKELAEGLGWSPNRLAQRLGRLRKGLRRALEEEGVSL